MQRIHRCLAVLGAVVALGVAGCADANQGQAVRSLQAQVESLQRQNQDYAGQVTAYQAQVNQQQKEALLQREEYREALASPGYEAAFRLVYADLQAGDTGALRFLLPPDLAVEAGIMLNGTSTYRLYTSAADLDLAPFAQWALGHPGDQARYEVFARQPGYAWVHAYFPDGTRFSLFFAGRFVVKVLISDQPFDIT